MLHRTPDIGAPAFRSRGRPVTHAGPRRAELGRQHDLVTAALQHLAEKLLGAALAAVTLRGVEQRDAGVDGRVHHRPGAVNVEPATEVVAAESDDRDDEPGAAKRPVAHEPAFDVDVVRPRRDRTETAAPSGWQPVAPACWQRVAPACWQPRATGRRHRALLPRMGGSVKSHLRYHEVSVV